VPQATASPQGSGTFLCQIPGQKPQMLWSNMILKYPGIFFIKDFAAKLPYLVKLISAINLLQKKKL
jgi:hypothetical protein